MSDEIETYKAKLALAYRAGYSGDAAVNYAECIPGDDVDSATANAKKLASVVAALNDNRRPADSYSNHDNDDQDAVDSVARSDFASVMGEYL